MVATVRAWSSRTPSASSTSIMPSTPFIGVLISWLMVARKVDLAWLAASASARDFSAATSACSRSRWRWRSSETSLTSRTARRSAS